MPLQLCPVIVGREAELDALRYAMNASTGSNGQCVLLVGEAGIGKSRLAREVTRWATEDGARVPTGRAVPASASTAYGPVTEFLLQLFRRVPLPDDPGLAPWLPLLQPLVPNLVEGVVSTPEVSPGLGGEAVVQLLDRVSDPVLVVVLEDLHWADRDTVALVEYLADNVSGIPVLLVLTLSAVRCRTSAVTTSSQPARPAGLASPRIRPAHRSGWGTGSHHSTSTVRVLPPVTSRHEPSHGERGAFQRPGRPSAPG